MAQIDELTIAVESTAEQASSGLDVVIQKLKSVADGIANIKNIAEKNPIKIKIDTSAVKNLNTVKYSFQKAFDNTKVDTSKLGEKLAKDFGVTSVNASKKISKQFNELLRDAVDNANGKSIVPSDDKLFTDLGETIANSGKLAKASLRQSIAGMENEYRELYEYFNKHKIYVSDFLKADVGKSEYKELLEANLSKITRDSKKGINLNKDWGELSSRFSSIIPKDTANQAEQLFTVLEKIAKARDEIKPIPIENLASGDQKEAVEKIYDSIVESMSKANNAITEEAKKIQDSDNIGLTPSVKINEDYIVMQIKSAIRKASSIKYDPVRINLDVDISKLKSDLKAKLKEINLSELSKTFSELGTIPVKIKTPTVIAKTKLDINSENFDDVADSIRMKFRNSGMDFKVPDGFQEIEKAANSLENRLDGLLKKENEMRVVLEFGGGIDGNKFIKLQGDIADTSNKLEILNEELRKTSNASSEMTISRDFSVTLDYYKESLQGLRTDVQETIKGFKEISNVPIGSFDTNIENYEEFLEGLKKDFPEAIALITEFEKDLLKLQEISSGLTRDNLTVKVDTNASEKIKEISQEVEAAKKSMKEAGFTAEQFEEYLSNIQIPEIRETNLKKLQAELEKTEKKLDELTAKSDNLASKGVNPDSAAFRSLQEQIVTTSKKSDALQKKIKEISEIKPNVSGWQKLTALATLIEKSFSTIKRGVSSALNSIKKLGRGFQNLGSIVRKVSSSIGKLFSNITQLASKATSAVTSSIKGITNAFSKLKGESSGFQTVSSGIGRLTKAAGGLLAAKGLVDFGKEAVELGSDITEVENVVDTAFGSMAGTAYDFASIATEQFGLSELAAKQYTGTMMAMLKSSNIPQQAAATMSTTLAGLAGDIASFYNIETDDAFKKLRSGIAGQTAPLKQLGINMNVANLEAYAMANGINKAYKEMTLAEQTLLRYNYIIAKTGNAQGDFARTAGTWANQLRLLRLNLKSISAIIGQGLIAALLPAIKLLNKFMAKLTQAAKKFRDFMYVLFGKKIESNTRGIVDDMADTVDYTEDLSGISNSADDVADGMEDAADGTDDLTESAKKLKKALSVLPFDELNQLTGNLDDLSETNKKKDKNKNEDLGLDDLGLGDMSDMFDDLYDKQEIEPVNEWARKLREAFLNHDWEGLGKILAEMVNIGLKKLYDAIKAITPKVERAMRALAKVINSFVKWLDWDLLGRTIGAGVNLLVKAFNALFDPKGGIDLELLGRKLSQGFRGMINEIEWRELGNALGNAFMIPWRIASGFVEDMWRIDEDTLLTGWAETGNALAEAVHGIFEKINFGQIGETLSSGFNGIIEIIRNFRNKMYENNTWSMIAANLSDGLTNLFKVDLKGMAEQLSGLALDILYMLNDAVEHAPFDEFGYKIAEALFSIPWLTLFNQVFDFVAATLGRALGGFVNYMTTHAEQLGQSFANLFNTLFAKIKYITGNIPWDDIGTAISTFLNTAIAKIRPGQAAVSLGNFVTSLLGTMLQVAQDTHWDDLGRKIGNFLMMIPWQTIIGQVFDTITAVFGGLITGLGEKILKMLPSVGTALANGFNHAFETLKVFVDSMDGRWTEIGSTIATSLNNMISGIDWKTAGETFGRFVKGVIDVIFTVAMETDWVGFARGIGEFLDGIPWMEILGKVAATIAAVIGEVIAGLKETTSGQVILFLGKVWLGIKGFQLGNKVLEVVNEFAKNFGLLPQGVDSVIPLLGKAISKITGGGEGGIFGKIISVAKDVVSKVGQKLGFLPKGVTDTIPGISRGVETIAGGTGLFSKILSGASGLVSKIGPILGSIGSVIFSPQGLMIAGIVAGVAVIIANWDSVKKAAGEIWGAIRTAVTDVWEGLRTAAGDIWGGITTVITDIWNQTQEIAHDIWGGVTTVISDTWDNVNTITHDTWDGITTFLGDTWNGLQTMAGDIWGGITTGVSDIWNGLQGMAGDIWGAITGNVSDANENAESNTATSWGSARESMNSNMQAMASIAASVMESIKTTVATSMTEITATYTTQWQTIAGASSGVLKQVQAEVTLLMQTIKGLIAMSMQEIGAIFTSGWQAVSTMSAMAIEQISVNVMSKMTAMQISLTAIMQQISTLFSNSWTAIGTMSFAATEKMLQDVTLKMNQILQTVNNSMNAVKNSYSSGWNAAESITTASLSRISNTVTSKMNGIKSTVNAAMNSIQNTFKTKWNSIASTANQALNKMQSTVTSKMNSMKNLISTAMNSIQNTFKTKWTEIENTVSQSLNRIQSTVKSKMDSIKAALNNSLSNILSLFKTKWTEIENTVSQSLNRIQTTVTNKMNAIKSAISTAMGNIYNVFKTKWDAVSNTCTQALNKMQSIVSMKMSSIKTTVSNSMNSIIITFQNGMNRLPNITNNALTNVVNEFYKLPRRIGESYNNLFTAGKNAAQSLANGFMSVHIPTPHIRVSSWTQHQAGNSTYSTPNFSVNWYKKGGLAYNPSIVGIGEAGDEAILPLENNKTMRMIADSILDNYSGGGFDSQNIVDTIVEGVVTAMMMNQGNQPPVNVQSHVEVMFPDKEVLARAVAEGQSKIDYRMNPTPQFGY